MSYKPSSFIFYFILAVLIVENAALALLEIRLFKARDLSTPQHIAVHVPHLGGKTKL